MDSQSNPTPGLHLPQPSLHQGAPATPYAQPLAPQGPASAVGPNTYMNPTVSPPQPTMQQLPQEPVSVSATSMGQHDQPSATAPAESSMDSSHDDMWINKAKSIAEQYSSDPYMQSRALAKLRSEYMQARHNKVLKVEQ